MLFREATIHGSLPWVADYTRRSLMFSYVPMHMALAPQGYSVVMEPCELTPPLRLRLRFRAITAVQFWWLCAILKSFRRDLGADGGAAGSARGAQHERCGQRRADGGAAAAAYRGGGGGRADGRRRPALMQAGFGSCRRNANRMYNHCCQFIITCTNSQDTSATVVRFHNSLD